MSQSAYALDLRHARSIGLARTHLHHLLTASAINLLRAVAWLEEAPQAQTRRSHFARLAASLAFRQQHLSRLPPSRRRSPETGMLQGRW